jgi:NADPH:quinone reductase-like Zn-dependent oxidoreductase
METTSPSPKESCSESKALAKTFQPAALSITAHGGPEVLQVVQPPRPSPGPRDVLIRVKAAGVNFADLMMRQGLYPEAPPPPFVPGYECAGVVEAIGAQVTRFKVGDRVFGGTKFGGYTNLIALPEPMVRHTPAHMSHAEAASIPVVWMTAWTALLHMGRVQKGDRVLIQSAAGGVGLAATQIAAQAGAVVTGLVGSKDKFAVVKELGASQVRLNDQIAYDRDARFDIILDSVGGKSLKENFKRLAPGGRVISFGAASTVTGKRRSWMALIEFILGTPFYTPFRLMMENKGVYGLNMLQFFDGDFGGEKFRVLEKALDHIVAGFESKRYRTIIGKEFPLAQGGRAHEHLQSRANVGKVVLICDND